MNRYGIQHIVDSSYCFPVSENEIVIRLRTVKNDLKRVRIIYESKYVFGETQKKKDMERICQTELYDYYQVKLTLTDTRLAYIFQVSDDEKSYYFSEDGVTESYNYKLGYYNFFQFPYINKNDIMENINWMHHAVFYQIFVDRFYMGNPNKDTTYINCQWGEQPRQHSYAGGDLRGITLKLDYLKSLGITAIYLTPVFTSISNHKYDISDYWKIDSQFGTNEDLKTLVTQAHDRGMKIVLDAVFNHCSEQLKEFQDVIHNGKKSPYYDWFIIYGERPDKSLKNYEMFATCEYMPKFNTSNIEVQDYLIRIGTYYLREYDIDGWRLDVSDEVSHDFWKRFRKAIKSCKSDAVIIGENWHDASNYLRGDEYDSIMNYAFTKCCQDYFATETKDASHAAWQLNAILMRNTDTVNQMMLNLLDSHDTCRFYTEVGENREKMKAALCLLFLFPGAPCIFYGTEILIAGGYDPDCRKCMDWSKVFEEDYQDIVEIIHTMAKLRKRYDLSEARTNIYSVDQILAVELDTEEVKIQLYINNTDSAGKIGDIKIAGRSHSVFMNGGLIL